MNSKNISSLIYQKLSLRIAGMSISELVVACNLQEKDILLSIDELEKRGLIIRSGQLVRAIPWWNEDHLEIFLNIPLVAPDVFQKYCDELDSFCEELRSEGFQALRPYTHETALEIILGVVTGFALAEFAKGFLNELGKKLAGFVGKSVEKHHSEGVTEVEIKGVKHSISGVSFAFSVKGSDEESILKRFANLQESIDGMCHKLEKEDKIIVNGDGWEVLLRKLR